MGKNGNKGTQVTVDMTTVETRKNHPEGEYQFTVTSCEHDPDKGEMGKVIFKLKSDDGSLTHFCDLQPQSLWKLKSTLEALGVEVPTSKMKLKLESYVGLQLMGTVTQEKRDGKLRSNMTDMWPVEPAGSDEDDDDKTTTPTGGDDEEDDEVGAKYKAMDDDALFLHAKERAAYDKKKTARAAGRDAVIAKLVALDAETPPVATDDDEDDDD